MDLNDIFFDDDFSCEVQINEQDDLITLQLSDDLEAIEQDISDSYKEKMLTFLKTSNIWFKLAIQKIQNDTQDVSGLELTNIFVLSEQDDDPITFGLSFNLDYDREHGRGMKILGDTFEIIEYGLADIAFC